MHTQKNIFRIARCMICYSTAACTGETEDVSCCAAIRTTMCCYPKEPYEQTITVVPWNISFTVQPDGWAHHIFQREMGGGGTSCIWSMVPNMVQDQAGNLHAQQTCYIRANMILHNLEAGTSSDQTRFWQFVTWTRTRKRIDAILLIHNSFQAFIWQLAVETLPG